MDKQFEELLRSQQALWAGMEARLAALEKENKALREELAAKPAAQPGAQQAMPSPATIAGTPVPPQAPVAQPAIPVTPPTAPTAQATPVTPPTAPAVQATPTPQPLQQPVAAAPVQPAPNATWAPGAPQPPYTGQPAYQPSPMPPTGQGAAAPQANMPPYAAPAQNSYAAGAYANPPAGATAYAAPAQPRPTGQPYAYAPTPQPTATAKAPKPKSVVEARIGRITGIVGLLFILVGVVLALRYTYMHLLQSDWLKLGIAYLLGALFLGAGEVLSRRNKNAFSISLLAGGVGICLATTAAGYFNLRALPPLAACGICILVAAVALLLAMIHKSQLIGVFALVGGYMPMLAVDAMLTGPAKIYLLFLNLLVLFLAVNRDWKVLKCLSLACNTAALVYLFSLEAMLTGGVFAAAVVWDLVYLLGCFIIYMGVCLLMAVRQKRNLTDLDTVLIGVNTWVHFALAYWVLHMHGVPRAGGVIALVLSAGFWFFARASRGFLPRDHSARGLFYTTSFVLLPIGIVLLFRGDIQLYALLGAGAALWCAGIYGEKKWYRRAGGGIYALGVLQFIGRYSVVGRVLTATSPGQAVLPFGIVVLLALLVLATLLYKRRCTVDELATPDKPLWQWYQGLVLAAGCFYLMWLVGPVLQAIPFRATADTRLPLTRWEDLVAAMLMFLLPMALRHIAVLRARATTVVATGYTGLGLLLTTFAYATRAYTDTLSRILLAVLCCLAVLGLAIMLRGLPAGHTIRQNWLAPLAVALGLLYLTLYLVRQLSVPFNGMLLSILYLLAALGCIVAGFAKRKTVLRRFGLVVLYLSITKLFLLDLAFLPSGQRILSYFVFGFALLGISWVYQHYEKGLLKEDGNTNPPA